MLFNQTHQFNRFAGISYRHIIGFKSRLLSTYPIHSVVGMPALSPTMATGTIGKWISKVGDKVTPGVSIAEIETDKASMAFEAQYELRILLD